MAHDCTDQLESMMQMTQAALSVKNTAIDTLTSELNLLRTENDLLAQLASAKGVSLLGLLLLGRLVCSSTSDK